MASMQGVIKRLISDKGFGFVQASDGNEYFFHQSAVVDGRFDELREGQSLTFDTGQGPKGPRAENIRRALSLSFGRAATCARLSAPSRFTSSLQDVEHGVPVFQRLPVPGNVCAPIVEGAVSCAGAM